MVGTSGYDGICQEAQQTQARRHFRRSAVAAMRRLVDDESHRPADTLHRLDGRPGRHDINPGWSSRDQTIRQISAIERLAAVLAIPDVSRIASVNPLAASAARMAGSLGYLIRHQPIDRWRVGLALVSPGSQRPLRI